MSEQGLKGKILSIVDDYAASVIKAVMEEHQVGRADFESSKVPHFARARADAIKRLSADGFNIKAIARAMGMQTTSIEYHVYPNAKARVLAHVARSNERRRNRGMMSHETA